jgi:predicted P-loop ATPase
MKEYPVSNEQTATVTSPAQTAIAFLETLRPGGPWVLTAIIPDGMTNTITAKNADEIRRFVDKNDGKKNLYYSVNPTRTARTSKASKLDISAIEFSFVDLDSKGNETPEVAKARYLGVLETHSPAPTMIVDSGNGVQALWRLEQPIPLPEPIAVANPQRGQPRAIYSSETQAVIDDAEGRVKALIETLGSVAGTQNIDRILRLPGMTNLPNAKKVKDGRVACPTKLLKSTATKCKLEDFPTVAMPPAGAAGTGATLTAPSNSASLNWPEVEKNAGWLVSTDELPPNFSAKGRMIIAHKGNLGDLTFDLEQAGLAVGYKSWSDVGLALAAIFKNHGRYTKEQIAAALLCDLDCNQHVTKMPVAQQRRAVERMIARSHQQTEQVARRSDGPDWRERKVSGSPVPSMHNARLAITALGIDCRLDLFHNKTLFGYADDNVKHELASIVGEVSDHGILALRQLMSDKFGFDMEDKATRDAVMSLALEHCFNPVLDLISDAEANWDGEKRLDRMAADYFNCEDTPLNSAFMRKAMIALVKRAREPGCKFDTIIVLESAEGFNKSTAWRVLAGDENFSDEAIIGKAGREVQEQLSEIWIHENADLAGMKKAEVETVKAYASRQTDIARAAFARYVVRQPRHSIEVGTTNSSEYLLSQTGNRRFWPLDVTKAIDIAKLAAVRLQLIGEAATYQTAGESVVLDESMWQDAGVEQEQRRVKDPWEDILANIPVWHTEIMGFDENKKPIEHMVLIIHRSTGNGGGGQDVVSAAEILKHILEIPISHQTTATTMRLSTVMKQLGWQRNKNGQVTINGERPKGYFRPETVRQEAARQIEARIEAARQEDFQEDIKSIGLSDFLDQQGTERRKQFLGSDHLPLPDGEETYFPPTKNDRTASNDQNRLSQLGT